MHPLQQGPACGNHQSVYLTPVKGLQFRCRTPIAVATPRSTPTRVAASSLSTDDIFTNTSLHISLRRRSTLIRELRLARTISCRETRARLMNPVARTGLLQRRHPWWGHRGR